MEKLLLTGASGFIGRNIRRLLELTYEVTSCGIAPDDEVRADLRTDIPALPGRYDVVLHACGKAHIVPRTMAERQEFLDVNYMGTVNLCKALERCGVPKAIIYISTVAVYGCDFGEMITELHPLKGSSPYAISKIMAERHLSEWCGSHGVTLGILRASLIAGKNAPGNLGAMVEGIRRGIYLNIAGGKAAKSILMADDIVRILPELAARGGIYNVCDTAQPTMGEISELVARQLGRRRPPSIPYPVAWCMAKVGDLLGAKSPFNSYKLAKMTQSLTFSNAKARSELNWTPLDVVTHYHIQ